MPRMRCTAPLRAGEARGGWLLTWLTLMAAVGAARATDGPFGFNPVHDLRQALQVPIRDTTPDSPDLSARRQTLQQRTAALCSPPELREALLLDGWRNEDTEEPIAAIDRPIRLDLAHRFEQVVCEVLQKSDPAGQLAAANMLSVTAPAFLGLHLPGWEPRRFSAVLAELVRSNDAAVREAAAHALGQIHADPAVAIPAFQNLGQDRNPVLRRVAVNGLTNLVKGVVQTPCRPTETVRPNLSPETLQVLRAVLPGVAQALADPDPEVRRLSMEALQHLALATAKMVDYPRVVPATLPEEATAYRFQVEKERAEVGPLARDLMDLTAGLTPVLNDRDPAVRLLAHQTAESLSTAWRRLQDRAASVAAVGPGAPAKSQAPTLMPAWATQAQPLDPRPANRWLTLVPMLAWGASDPDVQVRRAAIDTLETLGDEAAPAAHALVCALADTDVFVRWSAARTLGRIGPVAPVAVVPGLIPLLADPDLDVRLAAAEALRSFGPAAREAVPALTAAVGTGNPALRLAAMQALEDVGLPAQAAIPVLATTLQAREVRVRLAAARLLGKFGPAALEVKETLRAALQDPDAEVRKTVSDALLHILPPPGRSAPVVECQPPVGSAGDTKLLPTSFSPSPGKRGRTLFAEDR